MVKYPVKSASNLPISLVQRFHLDTHYGADDNWRAYSDRQSAFPKNVFGDSYEERKLASSQGYVKLCVDSNQNGRCLRTFIEE